LNADKIEYVKIKLSAIWVAHFLIWTFGDILRFLHPGFMEEIIENPISNTNLMFIALLGIFQASMIVLSVVLEQKPNRLANIIMGSIFTLINIAHIIDLIFNKKPAWEYELAVVYLIFNILTIWYANKCRPQESQSTSRISSIDLVPPD
jgi:hypothetical protein